MSTIKKKVDGNEIHGRTPAHKPLLGGKKEKPGQKTSRWNPERKNVLQQINKDPTVNGRKADGACMWMCMSPYPDSPASVHAKCSAQPRLVSDARTCINIQNIQRNAKLAEQQLCLHWLPKTTRERHCAVYKIINESVQHYICFVLGFCCCCCCCWCYCFPRHNNRYFVQYFASASTNDVCERSLNQLVARHFFSLFSSINSVVMLAITPPHH